MAVAIVVMTLAVMMALGRVLESAQGQQAPAELYKDIPLDAKLILLDRRALDEAYHQHLIRLWNVWLSDGAREAQRITNGLQIARRSYNQAATEISKRESMILEQERK